MIHPAFKTNMSSKRKTHRKSMWTMRRVGGGDYEESEKRMERRKNWNAQPEKVAVERWWGMVMNLRLD